MNLSALTTEVHSRLDDLISGIADVVEAEIKGRAALAPPPLEVPKGYKWIGEYRLPKKGEFYLYEGRPHCAIFNFARREYHILVPAPAPKPCCELDTEGDEDCPAHKSPKRYIFEETGEERSPKKGEHFLVTCGPGVVVINSANGDFPPYQSSYKILRRVE